MDDDELSPGMSEIVRDLPPPEAPTPPPPAPTIANVEWTPELMHQLLNNGRALANPPSVLQFDARECLDHDPHGIRANEEHCVSCFEAMLEALKAQPVEVERKGSFDDDEEEGAFDDAELEELEAELGGEESSAEQTAALAAPPTSASGPPASPAAPPPVADGTAADAVPSPRPLESLESLESALDSAAVDEAVDTGGCLGFRRRRRRRPRVAPSSSLPATDDTPTVADASASSKKSSRTETAAERQARKDAEAIAAAAAKTAALETKQLQAERDKESKKKAKGAAKRAAERAAAVEEEGRRRRDAEEKREAAFFVRWETITRTEPDNDPIHTAFMRTIMAKVGPLAAEGLQFYINKADLPPIRTVKKTNQRKKRKKQVEIVGGRQGGSVGSASVGSASVSDAGSVGVGGGGGRGGGARPESNEDGSMDGLSMEGSSIDSLDGSVGSNEDGEWGLAELSESPSEDEEDEYTDPSYKLELRGCTGTFVPVSMSCLRDCAVNSAISDPHALPLMMKELPLSPTDHSRDLRCTVFVCDCFEPTQHPYDWVVGRHGLVASLLSSNGTMYGCVLLPQLSEHMDRWSRRHAVTKYSMDYTQFLEMRRAEAEAAGSEAGSE